MKANSNEAVKKTVAIATTGASAGAGIASLFGAALLMPALIGGGIACIGAAIMEDEK